ncbi:MAG: cation:proton antiporter [Planctomycetota bacterium]|jgi:NhaP-type Na+/H+ or K+/H+ antiporter
MTGLALIVVLGAAAQYIASRLRIPSILLLVLAGFAFGTGGPVAWAAGEAKDGLWASLVIDPDALFGTLLFPIVSLSVAILLFEGGLGLRAPELKQQGAVVFRLITVGALVTWVLTTLAARLALGMTWPIATLLGALLTVTGPTVVQPLLRNIRPAGASGPILKWEGILIDPIGAVLAVLVLEGILGATTGDTVGAILKTILVGGGLGAVFGVALAILLERFWLPDHLHNPVTLALVFAGFVIANTVQHEAGLLTVTLMGVYLANQKRASVRHILEFKENVRDLLISTLFILLTARLDPTMFGVLPWGVIIFLAFLLVVVRPASVWASTVGSSTTRADRAFMAWMAPRGIVAAAVASIFAERLGERAAGFPEAVFAVILVTVLVYGLTGGPLARRLKLAEADPQGFLLLGAQAWAREFALALKQQGLRVLLVDMNPANAREARMAGLEVFHGRLMTEEADEDIDLAGLGRFLALTPNDEVNALAALHYVHDFGRREIYQVVPQKGGELEAHMRGRHLFGADAGYWTLASRVAQGGAFKATPLSEQFDFAAWQAKHGEDALPLVVFDANGKATLATANHPLDPKPGDTLLALVS